MFKPPNLKIRLPGPQPDMVLPWPARLWKPEWGAVEEHLTRSFPWRLGISAVVVMLAWRWAFYHTANGAGLGENLPAALIVSIFIPAVVLIEYPRQRRREVRLPFCVEIGECGITFKLASSVSVPWSNIAAFALCDSRRPGIRQLEVLISGDGEDRGIRFPYDPEETDETLLRSVLAGHLEGLERMTVCSVDLSKSGSFMKN